MPKKLFALFVVGILMLSACQGGTDDATATEATTIKTDITATEEGAEPSTEVVVEGEQMPCSPLFDYETTEEADFYQAVVDQLPPVTEDDWVFGDPDAPITIVEYEDFQCPACPGFSLYVKQLVEIFPSTIRVVFRHLPLPSIHDKAYISAMAAEAAGVQGKFWEMHDLLYENQNTWAGLSVDDFVDWVKTEGEGLELDVDQFEADLFDEEKRAALENTTNSRLESGLNYTPFVVINDRIYKNGKPNISSLIGYYHFDGFAECPPWVIDPEKTYTAVLDTTAGEIRIELFPDAAPLAVNSFVFLAQNGWFDDIYFHRVIEDFVAQAGDPSGIGNVGPGYTFANEISGNLSFDSAGILGMANSGADNNGSQFFITLAPATELDGGYTIFGQVDEGSLSVLDDIALRNPGSIDEAQDLKDATLIHGIEIIEE
jgi:cyclophilin family peptidyl-prolyl cis-trans isomerase/protein-disulfide isomerase